MAGGALGIALLVILIVIVLSIFFSFVPVMLWISAMASGVYVGLTTLVGMRLRRIVPARIVNPLIKARKAGLDVDISQLETH
ncbi:MAG: flotillin-like FloA family protein, partial [Thermoactinomyces sp.]